MPDTPRQTHRSFTVRVPMDRYLKIAALATEDKTNMNVKVNQLLELGMGREIKIEDAISQFVKKAVGEQNND